MTTNPLHDPTGDASDDAFSADLAGALATLVRDEPVMGFTVEDAERRGRLLQRRRRRTRVGLGAGMLVAASSTAFLAAGAPGWPGADQRPGVALGPTATSSGPAPVTDGPTGDRTADPTGDPTADPGGIGGIGLPVGFPVDEAFVAVQEALPDGVRLGDLPPDVGWVAPGDPAYVAAVRVPLARDGVSPLPGPATLLLGSRCALDGADAFLDERRAQAVADAVCAVWTTWGRPDPLAVPPAPSTPPDPAS